METIAERGHSAMTWLLGLGLIASWAAALDTPPPVVDTAHGICLSSLVFPKMLGIEGDPLAGLPPAPQATLAQLRYECYRSEAGHASNRNEYYDALAPMTVENILLLGREVSRRADESRKPVSLYTLGLGRLREQLARLEAWHHKSGLSPSATLQDLQTELGSRIQVPGTEQLLDVPDCLVFVGLGIVALQLYLLSMLATIGQMPADAPGAVQSWVVFHRAPLGPVLAMLWIFLPGVAWLLAAVILPLGRMESHPTMIDWCIAVAIVSTLVLMPRSLYLVRRRHLGGSSESSTSVPLTVQRQAA